MIDKLEVISKRQVRVKMLEKGELFLPEHDRGIFVVMGKLDNHIIAVSIVSNGSSLDAASREAPIVVHKNDNVHKVRLEVAF